MGIRPNGDGAAPPVQPDNPESRYSSWLTDLEDSGEIVGGVWQETDAKASSGNDGVSDLAGRLAALEAVSTASGTGWSAVKRNGVCQLVINGAYVSFTLPAGFRPQVQQRAVGWGDGGVTGRVIIATTGVVTFYDALAPDTIRAFGGTAFII